MTPAEKHALRAVADAVEAVATMVPMTSPNPAPYVLAARKLEIMHAAVRAVEQEDGSR